MEHVDGSERYFSAEDPFFLTADTRGVIHRINRVFGSPPHHSSEELVSSPHNTTRHDDMPVGALKFMWDELEQGRSSRVYALNRVRNGRDYRVFTMIALLTNGYLSVRMCPTNHTMFIPVKETCVHVRAAEHACVEEGHGRREVVEYGAALLTEELARLQYHDLHDFARAVLPCELALLIVKGMRVPPRAESDNPMSTVLQAVVVIKRDTDELIYQLDEYQELINGLGPWVAETRPTIDWADRVGSFMGEAISPDAESSVPTVFERVRECGIQAVEALGQSNSSPVAFYEVTSEARFRSLVMCLYALMAGTFAAAVLDGQEGESDSTIGDLAEAVLSDPEGFMPSCWEVANPVERLEGDLRFAVSSFGRVEWPSQRRTRALQDEGTQVFVKGVDAEIVPSEAVTVGEQGSPETASLAELAAKTHDVIVTLDEPTIRRRVAAVRETLSYLEE